MSPERDVTITPTLLSDELAQIVRQMQLKHGYGTRRAKRFVGRRANRFTMTVWRAMGQFPIGFRRGSKR